MNGGYDEGYEAVPCFWGIEPGSLVRKLLDERDVEGWRVLDLGCGEGKNAAALAARGAEVVAVDCSEHAIANGRRAFPDLEISWRVVNVVEESYNEAPFDLVIMYGLTHCLADGQSISRLINNAINATKIGGLHVLVAFNDRSQNLERAHPGFQPTLLPHDSYVSMYDGHDILVSTDTDLHETHPHNNVPHHHSMTRIIVKI